MYLLASSTCKLEFGIHSTPCVHDMCTGTVYNNNQQINSIFVKLHVHPYPGPHSHTHSTLFTSTNLADPKTITRGTTVCKSMQCLLQTKYAGSNLKRQRRKMIMFPAVSLRNEECSCCCHNPSPLRPIESQWQATKRTPCIQPTTPTLCNHLLALVHDGCKNKRGPWF